jgi:hypothetical protein
MATRIQIQEPEVFFVIEKMNEELRAVQQELEETKKALADKEKHLNKATEWIYQLGVEREIVYEHQPGVLHKLKYDDFTKYILWYFDLSREELSSDIDKQISDLMEAEHFIHIQKIEAETEEWKVVYILAHENDCDSIEKFIELNEKGEIDIE